MAHRPASEPGGIWWLLEGLRPIAILALMALTIEGLVQPEWRRDPFLMTEVEPGRLDDRVMCLALNLYWEARGEGRAGMEAVAAVVRNRVAHRAFPDDVCEIVYQGGEIPPCQFSWWCDGLSDRPKEADAWAFAVELARQSLAKPPPDPTGGAVFYHRDDLAYPFTYRYTPTVHIGRHVFYRLPDGWDRRRPS